METTVGMLTCSVCGLVQSSQRFCIRCGTPTTVVAATTSPIIPLPPLSPQLPIGVGAPALRARLPHVPAQGGAKTIHWVGVHGGAGESTLAQALPGSVAAGRGWPIAPSSLFNYLPSVPVVLVARSHGAGLVAAQSALQEWASGLAQPAHLVGLIVIADSPEKLPKELRALQKIVAGGAPIFWQLPYISSLRLPPESVLRSTPPKIASVCKSVQILVDNL